VAAPFVSKKMLLPHILCFKCI